MRKKNIAKHSKKRATHSARRTKAERQPFTIEVANGDVAFAIRKRKPKGETVDEFIGRIAPFQAAGEGNVGRPKSDKLAALRKDLAAGQTNWPLLAAKHGYGIDRVRDEAGIIKRKNANHK